MFLIVNWNVVVIGVVFNLWWIFVWLYFVLLIGVRFILLSSLFVIGVWIFGRVFLLSEVFLFFVVCCLDGVVVLLEVVVFVFVVCDLVVVVGWFIFEVVVVVKGKDGVEFDNFVFFFVVLVVFVCVFVVVIV